MWLRVVRAIERLQQMTPAEHRSLIDALRPRRVILLTGEGRLQTLVPSG